MSEFSNYKTNAYF